MDNETFIKEFDNHLKNVFSLIRYAKEFDLKSASTEELEDFGEFLSELQEIGEKTRNILRKLDGT